MRYLSAYSEHNAGHMSDLDPERFTLRQAAQTRDDFAQVMDELEFVKELIARLPTRRDQAFQPLRIAPRLGIPQRGLRHPLARSLLAALPLRASSSWGTLFVLEMEPISCEADLVAEVSQNLGVRAPTKIIFWL